MHLRQREHCPPAGTTMPSGGYNIADSAEKTGFRAFQREILHTATAILAKLKEPGTAAKFVAYAMPDNFVADLESDLAAAGALGGEQNDDRLGGTGDTARIRALVREGRELLESLDASVRNRFRDDPETLAEWCAAARIHRRKRTSTPPPPAPPAPSAPSA